MLNQHLSLRMQQKLSPQQIQLMKLLQIPTATLEQRIKEELEANPALEETDDEADLSEITGGSNEKDDAGKDNSDEQSTEEFELDDYINEYLEDDPSSYLQQAGSYYDGAEEQKTIPIPVENTFYDHLEQQLGLLDFRDERERLIALQILGSIDEEGYLRRDISAIVDDLAFSMGINTDEQEVQHWLKQIQNFDPPGIGAKDLKECLSLQLKSKLNWDDLKSEDRLRLEKALSVIDNHFELFSKKHYQKIKRQLGIKDFELKEIIDEILKLNPKPAGGFTGGKNKATHYIVPDFTIENKDGELTLTLNAENAPTLYVNGRYKNILMEYRSKKGVKKTKSEKETAKFIKQKIESAQWFIDAIRQRYQTMHKTMEAIMFYQYDYFLTGDDRTLKPMILKDIAEITEMDISTVSRVVNSKYVQTEFGTKRLKEFFSESIMTARGEEVSTLEVKNILAEIIAKENKKKPFSDEKLKNLLQSEGYMIARRTVAKYREQLNIPVARLRKEL